jgi:thiamine pyrophosphate-dependent acetolactate synthase large subunit-like protein
MSSAIQDNFGEQYYQELPTLGQSIAQQLQLFGVQRVYGVGGDFVANFINALSEQIAVLPSSNEMHAGFSACAQAELNALGVCLTTYTVGSLPCTSAAALARTEGLPVVFISGAPGEAEINRDALHHSVHPHTAWHTDLDAALNAFKALGLRAERLQGQRHSGQPNVAAEQFLELVSYAYVNRQPVYIEIPRDLVFQPTQALRLPKELSELKPQPLNLSGAEYIATQIEAKLASAKYPLVFLGEKLRLNKALLKNIIDFCHQHGLPYGTSWFGKGMLDESDPLCLGSYNGVFSRLHHQAYIDEKVDYVLELGSAIFPSDTNNAFSSQTHVIDKHPNKTMVKGTARWEQDIAAIIAQLSRHYNGMHEPLLPIKQVEECDLNATLAYHNIALCINRAQRQLKQPFIVVPEVGNALFASFELETGASDIGRSYLANPWYAAMGTSLPYARAISDQLKQCGSEQPILVLTGDGGFNFQANELINLQKQRANAVIVYMRNNIFHLGKAGDAPIYACNDAAFDPKMLVAAYGGKGHLCQTSGQFIDTLATCVERGGLHLIEVPTGVELALQSDTTKKLNCYIGYRNGDLEATKQWQALCR